MGRKKLDAALILMVGALLAGCSNENASGNAGEVNEVNPLEQTVAEQEQEIKELEEQLVVLQSTIDSQEIDLRYAKDEAAIYRGQVEGVVADMSDNELTEFAKSQWTYELTVNGEAVPADGQIALDGSQAEVTIVQKQAPVTVLPQEVFSKGAISGNYHEHVQSMSQEPGETIMSDGTMNTAVTFVFLELSKDEEFTFQITEELKERLGLEVDQITISTE